MRSPWPARWIALRAHSVAGSAARDGVRASSGGSEMTALIHTAPKILAIGLVALRQALAERMSIAVRALFYGVVLLVFSQLWTVVLDAGALDPERAGDYVWYLAITEWVVLSVPQVHPSVEADLQDGAVAYRMARPLGYLWAQAAETLGEVAVRLAVLAVAGTAFAWLLTGGLPTDPRGLVWALPLGVLSALALVGMQLVIAFAAFWLHDASPIYWVWQKAVFVLGGLMLPLDIYPTWLREIALHSPFGPLLYGVGRTALTADPTTAATTLAQVSFWTLVAWVLAFETQRRAVRRLLRDGG